MSNLRVNYEAGIEEAIGHLVSLGHREITFVGGPAHLRSAARRLEAFRASMGRHLPDAAVRVLHADFKLEGGKRAGREMLSAGEPPTAVVAANDLMALGVMAECRAAGLSIPRDLSIVGFDDIAFAALAEPPLTTVCLPRGELGRRAVEALMMTTEQPDGRGVEVSIPTYLVIRASTAVARGKESRAGRDGGRAARRGRDTRAGGTG
jgi:LacI family transcriptional regulator